MSDGERRMQYASGQPVSGGAQAALAVMLSMSLVGSLAKLEVFFQNTRQMKMTAE